LAIVFVHSLSQTWFSVPFHAFSLLIWSYLHYAVPCFIWCDMWVFCVVVYVCSFKGECV
jgi:hypothetical protein